MTYNPYLPPNLQNIDNVPTDDRCQAQVKEDWCNELATQGNYCDEHAEEFGE